MTTQFRCLDAGTPLTVARHKFRRVERIDEYPDTSWLDDESGRERLVAFREGTWHLLGIQASGVHSGLLLEGALSALVHSSHNEDREKLFEAQREGGLKAYLERRDGPFQPEPMGPRAKPRPAKS